MIATRIMGYLKQLDFEILKNKESKYLGLGMEAYDGPTILWILFGISNTLTRVEVSELKADIKNATSEEFKYNVRDLTDYLSSKCRIIIERGQRDDDFFYNIFNAWRQFQIPYFLHG